jgi:hypothetical protein
VKKKKRNIKRPFEDGDRVMHEKYGTGVVIDTKVSGGGNWYSVVEFDQRTPGPSPKIICSYLSKLSPEEASDEHSRASGAEA